MANKVTLRCCACPGEVTFFVPESENDEASERPTFLHTWPPCERFNTTNTANGVLDYFAECGHLKRAPQR